LEKEAELQPQ